MPCRPPVVAARVCVASRDRFLVECSGSVLCLSKRPRWRVSLVLGKSALAGFPELLEKAPPSRLVPERLGGGRPDAGSAGPLRSIPSPTPETVGLREGGRRDPVGSGDREPGNRQRRSFTSKHLRTSGDHLGLSRNPGPPPPPGPSKVCSYAGSGRGPEREGAPNSPLDR